MSRDDITVILQRLDEQAALLDEIRAHAARTNGRVMELELWRARVEGVLTGASRSLSWLPTVATGVLTGGIVAAITQLIA